MLSRYDSLLSNGPHTVYHYNLVTLQRDYVTTSYRQTSLFSCKQKPIQAVTFIIYVRV